MHAKSTPHELIAVVKEMDLKLEQFFAKFEQFCHPRRNVLTYQVILL